jgi:hypothetical protein
VIVQAVIDYADSRRAKVITSRNQVDEEQLRLVLKKSYPSRMPLPKWMEPSDVFSCVWFLFNSSCLEDFMPCDWEVAPDAVRAAAEQAARSKKPINHFFLNSWREIELRNL